MPAGFIYILASKPYGTLYIGVTSDLLGRIDAHHLGEGSAFVRKYGVSRLVYFEEYPLYADAIRRETNLKKWKRDWKIALVEKPIQSGKTSSKLGISKVGWPGQARPW